MKVKNFVYRYALIIFMLVIIFCFILPLQGDIGGGSGIKITPYVPNKEIKEEEVVTVKSISRSRRTVKNLKLKGKYETQYGIQVGLMYVKGQNVIGRPFFKFKGVTESGDEVIIDFSEVKSFSILKVESRWLWFGANRALLEIIVFPNISPRELLTQRLTYSELKEKYTKKESLWVNLDGENNSIGEPKMGDR